MKTAFLVGLGLLVVVAALVTASGTATRVHFVSGEAAAVTLAKPVGDPTRRPLFTDEGLALVANRRGAPGIPEMHDKTNHLFIIMEGEATFVTGGTITGSKQTAPGQIRGVGIEGGQSHRLTKGAVVAVPANTPHWFKEVPSTGVAFYVLNTEN
jgi:mannose-6-phosphate isomerase-like protein (cupin superfamily)